MRAPDSGSVKVEAIVFDLGGVLLDWNPDRILDAFYADAGLRPTMKRDVFQHPDWLELDRGTLTDDEASRRFSRRTGRPVEEMQALMKAAVESLAPIPRAVALVRELEARGVPLYCLSNMLASAYVYLQRYDFWRLFRGVVISSHVRLMKPDRAIFDHLVATYALDPSASLFIDDHPPNVEGARRAGLQALLFVGVDECRAQLDAWLGPPGSGDAAFDRRPS